MPAFSAKEDRQAGHIANTYGGGKAAMSIGYATVNKRRGMKAKRKRKRTRGR
jgi:hypothetical protein